ncbi:MAG TPA: DUF748 domain-containing protein, partial [Gammaproteobacteria bacterium]|nr:DUF748 domain-containing protein [Gammaproteobacteria bacterium]
QGIESSIDDISIGLFSGTVSLRNAKGYRDDQQIFNIGLIDIHWRWAPLSEKTIEITRVTLDQLHINIERYTDRTIISGIDIPIDDKKASAEKAEKDNQEDEQSKHWSAALGSVLLTNIDICYLQYEVAQEEASTKPKYLDYCVTLQDMSWQGKISYTPDTTPVDNIDLPLSTSGDFRLNGLTIHDNKLDRTLLASRANTLNGIEISGLNNIHISQLEMNGLSALERDDKQHADTARFDKLSIHGLNLRSLNILTIDDIRISKPGGYLVKDDRDNWEFRSWIPVTNDTPPVKERSQETKGDPSTFQLSVGDIAIDAPDFCYLEKNTVQYYCFTATAINWAGAIKFSTRLHTDGSLVVTRPDIRNYSLDRDLLSLNSLGLTGLKINDIDNLSLDKFNIDNLSALQRSKKDNDTTVSFDKLAINNIKYTNNKLFIDTAELDGLSGKLSKNKDGHWEHDKWLARVETTAPEKPAEKNDKKAEPFLLSLNRANITTENKILFIDDSTTPETTAGLSELDIDLSNLNSDKPDNDSLFKLSAKTTRRSTIDLEGTFRPFADKVSLNADGKLKGLDLRAASPAAKKAIGHIIKSGQLDADLKLRAVDGILDSNIALSLYHFKLKANSKKDADRLDKLFGLPINQSLTLLREKDDSIHLDIPITGDINKPNFDPMDAIIKATTKATTLTLITFYTPYGLVYAGGNALFDLATALNFDPIEFEPGSPALSDKNKESLIALSKLLTEKPEVRLTLCGNTSKKDLFALFPETEKSPTATKSRITLSEQQTIALDKLAKQRQVNSKNYLIDQKDIAHERLILCAPEYNPEKDGLSGVEINI